MQREEGISDALRKRGVAASTIREALGTLVLATPEQLVRKLASAKTDFDSLIAIQVEAKAFVMLKRELDTAMQQGDVD